MNSGLAQFIIQSELFYFHHSNPDIPLMLALGQLPIYTTLCTSQYFYSGPRLGTTPAWWGQPRKPSCAREQNMLNLTVKWQLSPFSPRPKSNVPLPCPFQDNRLDWLWYLNFIKDLFHYKVWGGLKSRIEHVNIYWFLDTDRLILDKSSDDSLSTKSITIFWSCWFSLFLFQTDIGPTCRFSGLHDGLKNTIVWIYWRIKLFRGRGLAGYLTRI
jgi:hypothetical protein